MEQFREFAQDLETTVHTLQLDSSGLPHWLMGVRSGGTPTYHFDIRGSSDWRLCWEFKDLGIQWRFQQIFFNESEYQSQQSLVALAYFLVYSVD